MTFDEFAKTQYPQYIPSDDSLKIKLLRATWNAAVNACAVAAANKSRVGRDYLPNSVRDNINNEVAKRLQAIAT